MYLLPMEVALPNIPCSRLWVAQSGLILNVEAFFTL